MRPPVPSPPAPAFDDVRRGLVVARETAGSPALEDLVQDVTAGGRPSDVRYLAPRDPLAELSQALRDFPADLVVIATLPRSRSVWLAHDVVARAGRAFGVPVAHLVVDEPAPALAAA